jgi:alpha,alpha-trehalose-phosphate synthase [UDP-forming]/trehalose-phosphatase
VEAIDAKDASQEAVAHWQGLARHTPLAVVCDLDGTLVPFTATPIESALPPPLVALLNELAALDGVRLTIASGRMREQLQHIMAPVHRAWLVAEHGAWRCDSDWESTVGQITGDIGPLTDAFIRLGATVRGALVERKSWSVTLHYRLVPEVEKEALLVELDALLEEWLAEHSDFERLDGVEVTEVRPRSVRKSHAVTWLRDRLGPETRLLVLGDDQTDEDMFRELGVSDDAVLVGRPRRSLAHWRVSGPEAVARLLEWVAATRRGQERDAAALPEPHTHRSRERARVHGRYDLLVIANRLPKIDPRGDGAQRKRNVGGLVAALQPALEAQRGVWLGWSGRTTQDDEPGEVELDEEGQPALAAVDFPADWYDNYYNGFSNRALWPLFHSIPRYASFADRHWRYYRSVNDAFAAAATELIAPDKPVWIHDYHLLLAARALRKLGHSGPLGLFLHTPFPGPNQFELLPWADQLLDAMLDLDLIGFHTPRDVSNFRYTVAALSPALIEDEAIVHRGRRVRVAAFPIGAVLEPFQEAVDPEVAEEAADLLRVIAPSRLVLGVDRLDYTKGIPERLEAFGLLLEQHPHWRGQVSLIQISVPSREDVPEYAEQRRRIENIVGRINGDYGEAAWVPIRYLYRSYSPNQLAELYRAAAVGYVTPLRDGMNLVAKEYVAAQNLDDPGVLVLSKFAGAAAELIDAVLTNPWHPEGVARDLDRALRMDLAERQARHRRLLEVVTGNTAATWAGSFLQALMATR